MTETLVSQAQNDLRKLGGELLPGEKVGCVIGRVATLLGWKYSRVFEIWYGRSRRIEVFECDQVREALARKELERLENDLHNWRISLAKMDAKVASLRADLNRPRLDLLGHEVRGRGRRARPSHSAMA
jgi:hypothetical protein